MDGGSMGGMDMGSSMFRSVNEHYSHIFWYLIAAFVACMFTARILTWVESIWRLRASARHCAVHPSVPSNPLRQAFATTTAIFRELSNPRFWIFHRPSLTWLNPPSLGRIFILFGYWSIIIALLVSNAIIKDAYYWERIAYRAAWISLMQVPLLYLLSAKCSIIGLLVGSSHERINWLHRWVARTLVVTAAIHGLSFYTEWLRAGIVELELEMMSTIVPYGFGAWGVLLWTLVVSLAPLRRLAYEVFVLQHIASAAIFLWLLHVHVPKYARYYIWFAVAAWVFDIIGRCVLFVYVNWMPSLGTVSASSCCCKSKGFLLGHPTDVQTVGNQATVVTIHNIRARWRPGQHFYVWFPRLGPLETHPYTVMGASPCGCGLQLIIRKHKGLSQRLHNFGVKGPSNINRTTSFITGPYGSPPPWHTFETLVLIAGSTGAAFTLPILQGILKPGKRTCIRRVDFLCMGREGSELEFYASQIRRLTKDTDKTSIKLNFALALTGGSAKDFEDVEASLNSQKSEEQKNADSRNTVVDDGMEITKVACDCSDQMIPAKEKGSEDQLRLQYLTSRYDIEKFITRPVEAATGETSVIVCGGGSLTCQVRSTVSKLSDERAVHKGSGLQGIHLHVEEYSF